MALPPNRNAPTVLWCDMNSSFASSEQQAHPLMRFKPLGVGKYLGPNGPIISPSVEAKRAGVKGITTVRDAKLIAPEMLLVQSDPAKYREMHRRLVRIFKKWAPVVNPRSIDEAVMEFTGSPALKKWDLHQIARMIKEEAAVECGSYIGQRLSMGIATNQFLAKTAAGLEKPNGLQEITADNLRSVFAGLELIDLCGINTRHQARLNSCGIFTPLQFLDAESDFLHRQVFGSITGRYWHWMLRGYEYQRYDPFDRGSFGNSHSMKVQKKEPQHNLSYLLQLCDMASRRMRREGYSCLRVSVTCIYPDRTHFFAGSASKLPLYTTKEVFRMAARCFNRQGEFKAIHKIAVNLTHIQLGVHEQLDLFATEHGKERRLMEAVDRINTRYGEQKVYPATMHVSVGKVNDSISFGSVGDMQELYEGEEVFDPAESVNIETLFSE